MLLDAKLADTNPASDGLSGCCAVPAGLNFLWLEITGKCNLECIHCYADSSPRVALRGKMALPDWLSVLDDAAAAGCRRVQFIGGEPTIHPDLDAMIAHAHALDFELIEVYTNATALTAKRLAFFKENGVSIGTSFYSWRAQAHERITKGHGSFARTVAGIDAVLRAGLPIRVGVIYVEGINDQDGETTLEFLRGLGVDNIIEDDVRGAGRGAPVKPDPCSDEYYGALCGRCWRGSLCITPDGAAYPCIMSRGSGVGNVLNGGLAHIIGSDVLIRTRETIRDRTWWEDEETIEAAAAEDSDEAVEIAADAPDAAG